jgi:hypothetical protein
MKKHWWIIVLLAAFVLVFSGCGGAKDDDDDGKEEGDDTRGVAITGNEAWWVAPGAKNNGDKRKYPDNKVPIIGEDDDASYLHIYFKPYGPLIPGQTLQNLNSFEITLKIQFHSDMEFPLDMMWQCAFDPYGTWARSSGSDDYIEMVYPNQPYTFTCQPNRIFTGGNWDTDKMSNGKTSLTLPEMHGLAIQIPIEYKFEPGVLEVLEFSYKTTAPTGPQFTGPKAN